MEDILVPIVVVGILFLGLPWIILHYTTQWRTAGTLTNEDEAMLDQMHETARRLEERLATIERIIAADDPGFRAEFRSIRSTMDDEFVPERRS